MPPVVAQQLGRIGKAQMVPAVTPREEREVSKLHLKHIKKTDFKAIEAKAIPADKLPDDTALEQMRASVEHNPLISYYIPDNKKLRQIHTQGAHFQKSPDLTDVIFATLAHSISEKFDVKFPIAKEERVLPMGFWDILNDIRRSIESELNNYGYDYHYD